MDLPESWVDRIFEKLIVTYGREFTDRWTGQDMRGVKADWAHELGGFTASPGAIKHALEHLPVKAPTVADFKRIARECTTAEKPEALENKPAVRADPQRVADLLAKLADKPEEVDGRQWAYDILARHKAGEKLSIASLRAARDAVAFDLGSAE